MPLLNSNYSASTNTGLSYSYKVKSDGDQLLITYEVESYFYPGLSWRKYLDERSTALLKHEQLHWDITELYRRILIRALKNYQTRKQYKKDLKNIYALAEKKRAALQRQYDMETRHGLLTGPQLKWEERIAQELFMTADL